MLFYEERSGIERPKGEWVRYDTPRAFARGDCRARRVKSECNHSQNAPERVECGGMDMVSNRSAVRRRSRRRRGAAQGEHMHPCPESCVEGKHGVGAGWRVMASVMWMSSIVVSCAKGQILRLRRTGLSWVVGAAVGFYSQYGGLEIEGVLHRRGRGCPLSSNEGRAWRRRAPCIGGPTVGREARGWPLRALVGPGGAA